jgi:hypothetical protein
LLPLSNPWVDNLFVCGKPDSTSSLDFFPILIKPITDDRLGAVFVCGDSLRREGIVGGIIKLFVISPVWAATTMSEGDHSIE